MTDSPPNGRGASPSESPAVDVTAMPLVLARIAGLAFRYPGRVALIVVTSLLGAAASLTLPRLFGRAVDQAAHLLAQGSAHADAAEHALLVSAGLVILATASRGFLTMASAYYSEYLSQKVAYDLRLAFFQQLQRLSFGFHDKVHSGDLITRGMLDLEGSRAFIQGAMQPALSRPAAGLRSLHDDHNRSRDGGDRPGLRAAGRGGSGADGLPAQGHLAAGAGDDERADADHGGEPPGHPRGPRVRRPPLRARQVRQRRLQEVLAFQYKRLCSAAYLDDDQPPAGLLLWYGGSKVLAGDITVGRLTEFLTYDAPQADPADRHDLQRHGAGDLVGRGPSRSST